MRIIKLTAANGEDIFINTNYIESFGVITKESFENAGDSIGMTYIFLLVEQLMRNLMQ